MVYKKRPESIIYTDSFPVGLYFFRLHTDEGVQVIKGIKSKWQLVMLHNFFFLPFFVNLMPKKFNLPDYENFFLWAGRLNYLGCNWKYIGGNPNLSPM